MACGPTVAHRAAHMLRRAMPMVAAILVAAAATVTVTGPAEAAYRPRVVIVVGPAGASTADYLGHARDYAAAARKLGAAVTEVYTPHATWSRVLAAAQGANVLIYLGHGNGWPSPYAPWQGRTKDGLGLNPYDGAGRFQVKYYGEDQLAAHIRLAPGAVVLLNRLCYASGAGEPGSREPSWTTAIQRVDNYAAGFLRAGAAAVIADGHTSLAYEIPVLFAANRTITDAWAADPDANRHVRSSPSVRTPGFATYLDPDKAKKGFYRSLVTRGNALTGGIHIAALEGGLREAAVLRATANGGGGVIGPLARGSRVTVRGQLTTDAAGRTWAPVTTQAGSTGWVAAWLTSFTGTAVMRSKIVLRASPSTSAARRGLLKAGTRLTIVGSGHDRQLRAWLKVRTSTGRTGWVAAWLTTP